MSELTPQQQLLLDAGPEPTLLDPRTKKAYVLIGKDVFERMRQLFSKDDSLDVQQVGVLVERAMREDDADDPTLEYYQQKYGRKS